MIEPTELRIWANPFIDNLPYHTDLLEHPLISRALRRAKIGVTIGLYRWEFRSEVPRKLTAVSGSWLLGVPWTDLGNEQQGYFHLYQLGRVLLQCLQDGTFTEESLSD